MNILDVDKVEKALLVNRGELFRLGSALIFIAGIMLFTIARSSGGAHGTLLVVAAMIGGYMAMNIGANDVANNVGPAVGSHAITLTGAIVIAAFFLSRRASNYGKRSICLTHRQHLTRVPPAMLPASCRPSLPSGCWNTCVNRDAWC